MSKLLVMLSMFFVATASHAAFDEADFCDTSYFYSDLKDLSDDNSLSCQRGAAIISICGQYSSEVVELVSEICLKDSDKWPKKNQQTRESLNQKCRDKYTNSNNEITNRTALQQCQLNVDVAISTLSQKD